MALPSRPQTFAYESCRDLVMKLERETDRYLSMAGNGEHDPAKVVDVVDSLKDAAFNASVTAWHLTDWVFNDMTPEQRERLGFSRWSDFQDFARTHSSALRLCELACVASKHWIVSDRRIKDPDFQILVTADNGWHICFVDNEKEIPAELVFENARAFWHRFILENEVAIRLDEQ